MDSGASFHATYCKEELERFKLRSDKIRLVDDKTLDFAGIRDVVLKTSFGTSWTLKDVRYISGLKRMLISIGQLNEDGYHHKRLDDMHRIGMNMLAFKGNVLDVRKVDIYFCKPGGLGKQKKLSFIMSVKTRKLQRAQKGAQIRVKGPKTAEASRIVEYQTKNTLKTEHTPRREASRLYRNEDAP
nr:retrovirus-related Pol polyprotein from transposon TNT 1-94 [Tanacetum cinerariifolium]